MERSYKKNRVYKATKKLHSCHKAIVFLSSLGWCALLRTDYEGIDWIDLSDQRQRERERELRFVHFAKN